MQGDINKLQKRLKMKLDENDKYEKITKPEYMENLKDLINEYKTSTTTGPDRNNLKIEINKIRTILEQQPSLQRIQDKIINDIKDELNIKIEIVNNYNKELIIIENK